MVITAEGCILHRGVQYDRCELGYSYYKCPLCGLDVEREAEDTGCGG